MRGSPCPQQLVSYSTPYVVMMVAVLTMDINSGTIRVNNDRGSKCAVHHRHSIHLSLHSTQSQLRTVATDRNHRHPSHWSTSDNCRQHASLMDKVPSKQQLHAVLLPHTLEGGISSFHDSRILRLGNKRYLGQTCVDGQWPRQRKTFYSTYIPPLTKSTSSIGVTLIIFSHWQLLVGCLPEDSLAPRIHVTYCMCVRTYYRDASLLKSIGCAVSWITVTTEHSTDSSCCSVATLQLTVCTCCHMLHIHMLSADCSVIYITEQVPLHAGVVNWMCAVLSYFCTDLNISLHS